MRALVPTIGSRHRPPEMIEPGTDDAVERLAAAAVGRSSANTNFGGGKFG